MRDDVEKDEFKYECSNVIYCDFSGEKCSGTDCRCCRIFNESEIELHASEMKLLVPYQDVVVNGIGFVKNFDNTIIKVESIDDAMKIFGDCEFFDIKYSPNEMYWPYPLFFRLKAHLSLGVPVRLLGNGEKSPLISAFGDGSVYVISVRLMDKTRW